jgi:uncharacterized membrane protein
VADFLNQYRKTIVALVGVVILVLQTELGSDSNWVTYAIALATALGVWAAPNKDKPNA